MTKAKSSAVKKITAKQERFCQEYIIDNNATQAAIRAGYSVKAANREGSRLLSNVVLMDKVAELRKGMAENIAITVESLAVELEQARQVAITEKQSSAAVAATMGKAKLFGLGSENRRVSGNITVVTITAKQLEGLTDDELEALERAYPILQRFGLVPTGDQSGETGETGD